jgi:putative ABC transport system substrate-binding protein
LEEQLRSWFLSIAVALPFAASAQQNAAPLVGFLGAGSATERAEMVDQFHKGLRESGYVIGKNVRVEYRWAEGHYERLPTLAAELIDRKVAVIATSGGPAPALAAKTKTSTIPIVFVSAVDPVKAGLVASLSRPGGNVTGIASIATSLDLKRLEILRELLPRAKTFAYLVAGNEPEADATAQQVRTFAESKGLRLHLLMASDATEIDAAFEQLKKGRPDALLVATNALYTTRRDQIVALAARHAIPASYSRREFVAAGGLISYGPDYDDIYRLLGVYTARVLKGAKPAELPVNQEARINLVVNLKTAKKLGIAMPRDFLQRVDEIIQ